VARGLREMWRSLDTAITGIVDRVMLAHLVAPPTE
jgi:hypothetical protein